jgi:hypothetical protein
LSSYSMLGNRQCRWKWTNHNWSLVICKGRGWNTVNYIDNYNIICQKLMIGCWGNTWQGCLIQTWGNPGIFPGWSDTKSEN